MDPFTAQGHLQYTLMPDLTWLTLENPEKTELLWNGRGSSKSEDPHTRHLGKCLESGLAPRVRL